MCLRVRLRVCVRVRVHTMCLLLIKSYCLLIWTVREKRVMPYDYKQLFEQTDIDDLILQ